MSIIIIDDPIDESSPLNKEQLDKWLQETLPKRTCDHKPGKIIGMVLVSKYMVKKYGFAEACRLIIERKNKRSGK